MLTADASMTPAFQQTTRMYEERFDRLVEEAVRPMGDDALAVAMVGSVRRPAIALRARGQGFRAGMKVVETSLAMILPWLVARLEGSPAEACN